MHTVLVHAEIRSPSNNNQPEIYGTTLQLLSSNSSSENAVSLNVVIMWSSHGHHVVIMWSSCGHHVVITWLPCGHHVVITWSSCEQQEVRVDLVTTRQTAMLSKLLTHELLVEEINY